MFVDRPVGIDLGTTNSEIAMLDPSERDLHVYADRFGRRTVPSAVAWDPRTEQFLVGRRARNRRGKAHPPVESIKRKMGQSSSVRIGPHELSPEEVSAKILGELRRAMLEDLRSKAGEEVEVRVDRAVITVPAYFDAPQVEATRRAGELAGLTVLGILQEPTAAAIYHTWRSQLGDGNFLIYDLGGGTFDVSILRCLGGEYQVLAIDGDNYLGGDDLDRRYAEHLRKRLIEQGYALDLDVRESEEDAGRFLRLVHLAQEIKESLSTSEVIHVSKDGFMEDQEGEAVSFESEVGRADYEAVIGELVETTIECCNRALAQSQETAGVGIDAIDHVVLVGGSTRVPIVARRVTEALCARSKSEAPLQDEVDTCVALGAAVHAAQLGGLRLGHQQAREGSVVEAQVLITTPLVGRKDQLKLGLKVEVAPEGAAELAILEGDEELAGVALTEIPSEELRLTVPLGEREENPASIAIRSGAGAILAELPFALYRGDLKPRASALSQPSVIAKDIALEVLRAGRRERKVLLSRGTGLPAEASHRFYTSDKSGAVVLRLMQNRLPIKTLMLAVPEDLPVGTPVDLHLSCDEAMRLEAKAEVAGQELWAKIEPSPQEPLSAAALEALLAEAEAVGRELWGTEAEGYRRVNDRLSTGIREAMNVDPDKSEALAAQLRQLIDEFKSGDGQELSPPFRRFELLLSDLRKVVYRSQGSLLGLDGEGWEERFKDLDERAREAWEERDAAAWRRVYNETQALLETASEQEFASMRLDDPAYLSRRLQSIMSRSNHIERALLELVPSEAPEVRALQLAERDRLLALLREKVTTPMMSLSVEESSANQIRQEADRMNSELHKIDLALERIPAIGLVTERGS